MSPSTLFAFFLLVVVSMIHPATSDAYSEVLREYAVTEPVRQHLEYKWLLKNFTLLPHRHGLCIRSPQFHTRDKRAGWIMRFCLQEGSRRATVSAALHLHPGSSDSYVLQDVDGYLEIFRSGQKMAYQVFNGAAVSVDSGLQIYEYLEDEVDVMSGAGPWDNIEIIGTIAMPTKIITELVESPYLMGVLDGVSNLNRARHFNPIPILNGPGILNGPPIPNGPAILNVRPGPLGPINGPIGGPGLNGPVGPIGPINGPIVGPGLKGPVVPVGPINGPLVIPGLNGPLGPPGIQNMIRPPGNVVPLINGPTKVNLITRMDENPNKPPLPVPHPGPNLPPPVDVAPGPKPPLEIIDENTSE